MPRNPILTTRASLANGETVEYRDSEASHVRRGHFAHIMDGCPLRFEVVVADGIFAVDLVSGAFAVDSLVLSCDTPPTPLRLIYYKRMSATPAGETKMDYFVVGWQTTLDGRNIKTGIKVFPGEHRWEGPTADI